MTNQYSIEIHDYVSEKIRWAEGMKEQAGEQSDLPLNRFLNNFLKKTTFRSYRIESGNLTWITGNKSCKVTTVCRKKPCK